MTGPRATVEEIVDTFDALDFQEITVHNWRTCGRDCTANWDPNDETYICGVVMILDFDFKMGYLIQTVDRSSSLCRYIAVLHRHGRNPDGTFDRSVEVHPFEHKFFDRDFDDTEICKWAVDAIYRMRALPYPVSSSES